MTAHFLKFSRTIETAKKSYTAATRSQTKFMMGRILALCLLCLAVVQPSWGWSSPHHKGRDVSVGFVPVTGAEEMMRLVRPDVSPSTIQKHDPKVLLKDQYIVEKKSPKELKAEYDEMLRRVIEEQSNWGGVDVMQAHPKHKRLVRATPAPKGHHVWKVVQCDATIADDDGHDMLLP